MSAERTDVAGLYEAVLAPKIAQLEGLRLGLKTTIAKSIALIVAPFFIFWFGDAAEWFLPNGAGFLVSAAGIVLVFVAVIVVAFRYLIPGLTAYLNYRQRFKHEIVSEIFAIVCPTASYDPDQGMPKAVFDEPGLFSTRGSYRSDDRVRGRIGDTPFEAAEVQRQYSTGGKNSTTYVVFKGLFFHIDFNKAVRGTTIVEPEGAPSYRRGSRAGLSAVSLENPEFERVFAVYSDNDVEARYILTPSMMEQVLSLHRRTERPVYLAFRNNRAYIGINYDRALFEPAIASTTSREAVEEMAGLFALAETIVHELELNTRIWTKGVDDSLLHRPDEAPVDGLAALQAQARSGTVTPQQLWDAAMAEMDGAPDDDAAPAQPPAGSSIRIDRSPGATVITYGGAVTFTASILAWLLCFPVAASALRANLGSWAAATGYPPFTAWAGLLPEIPLIDAWVATLPLVWLIGACVVGGVTALDWTMRVRTVVIEAGEIRVRRGLRPWPRRYARPPYNRISNLGKSVHLKSEGFSLLTPSASPMLREAEARWVAAQMRRALKETSVRPGGAERRP